MNAVSRLRRTLGDAGAAHLIATLANAYRLEPTLCEVDAQVFEARVAAGGRAASKGAIAEAAGLLRSALGLWRGPALTGLTGGSLELAAAAWEERRVAAQEMCYGYELALWRHREILGELAELAASNPLRERLAGLYMLALYRCGRQADALAVYGATRELLAGQMGLDPSLELRGLHQQMLTADPALLAVGTMVLAAGSIGTVDLSPEVPQVRHSLPADAVAFTGRGGELSRIMEVAGGAADGGMVAVGAIDGMPGVGKTALAVHAAHRLAAQFPDRQLFIDLRAHTAGLEPVKAQDALAGLLSAVGVDPRYLPGDLPGRAAMWRDRMAGQRALLVLDNAASSDQVAPLLPGSGSCLVLVTSRRHLGDLPSVVTPVLLDVLGPVEAAQMFTRLAPRAAGDRDGVAEVTGLAGFLPLAISLLARVFARHPSWSLADLAAETRAAVMTIAAEHDSVAAAFGLSYQYLTPAAQRLFRLLGMHPGTTVDCYAAAALAGIGPHEAAGLLDCLYREGLVTDAGYRRYGLHDLLSRYARDLAGADTAASTQQALARLLDYYQAAAALADLRLARHSRPGPAPSAPSGIALPDLRDAGQAVAWMRAERASLLACLALVARTGQHARVVALTAGLVAVLRRDGPWAEAITRHTNAVDAARRIGDRLGEASALFELGIVRRLADGYDGAAQVLDQALTIFRDVGDRLGEANALLELGIVRRLAEDHGSTAQVLDRALAIFRDIGDRLGEANGLREIGIARMMTGDYAGATQVLKQALDICRDCDDRPGEANTLTKLGIMSRQAGDYLGAVRVVEESLDIYRHLGDRLGQANALHELAAVRRTQGDYLAAARVAEESLGIYRDLGDRLGEANALHNLGVVHRLTGDHLSAANVVEESLGIFRHLGSRLGEANALQELGATRRLTGDHLGGVEVLEESLGIYRDLGDRDGETDALNELGMLQLARHDLARAQACHKQALDLARPMGNSRGEAQALAGLGRCVLAAGLAAEAEALLRQAHQIFQRIGAAETQDVLAELDTLAGGNWS